MVQPRAAGARKRRALTKSICERLYGASPADIARARRKQEKERLGAAAGLAADGRAAENADEADKAQARADAAAAALMLDEADVIDAETEADAAERCTALLRERLNAHKECKRMLMMLLKCALKEDANRRAAPPVAAAALAAPAPAAVVSSGSLHSLTAGPTISMASRGGARPYTPRGVPVAAASTASAGAMLPVTYLNAPPARPGLPATASAPSSMSGHAYTTHVSGSSSTTVRREEGYSVGARPPPASVGGGWGGYSSGSAGGGYSRPSGAPPAAPLVRAQSADAAPRSMHPRPAGGYDVRPAGGYDSAQQWRDDRGPRPRPVGPPSHAPPGARPHVRPPPDASGQQGGYRYDDRR